VANVVSRTVEVCVFRFAGGTPEYLLLKRAADERLYPNLWQFVTGTIRDGEKAVEAARRELQEETGLLPTRFWIVPYVSSFYAGTDDTIHMSPFFAAEVASGIEPVLSHEHQAYRWCIREDAEKTLIWPGQRQGLGIVHAYIAGGLEASRLLSLPV
jgi:dATP pyrophosphohydrolase